MASIQFIFISMVILVISSTARPNPSGTRACGQKEWYLKADEEMPDDKEHPFSWMISISETTFDGELPKSNICGASLIDKETVITAASCFDDREINEVMLILGAQHLSNTKEDHRETRKIRDQGLIKHPKYKKGKAYFDIAIIKLDRPVEFNIYLYPVCLPQVPVTDLTKRDGHAGTIMGWGETEDDDSQQNELGWIQLSVYGQRICNREYEDLKNGNVRNAQTIIHKHKIDEVMPEKFQSNIYCANAFLDNNGACKGDFGGPMTFFNTSDYPGYYTQIGVIQPFLSHICGNPKVPDILTRLEDVEVLDFVYENSLNEKLYNSEDYAAAAAATTTTKYKEYDDYNTGNAEVSDKENMNQEVSDQENEVDKEKDALQFDVRKDLAQ